MTIIEMVAYLAAHKTDEVPWRCVQCEILTKHTEDGIIPHLYGAHNLSAFQLKKEQDALFLYPKEGETDGKLHQEFSEATDADQAGESENDKPLSDAAGIGAGGSSQEGADAGAVEPAEDGVDPRSN